MFESSFKKIGQFSQKNRKIILAFWIILFLIMIPFATLLFTDTSYNVTNSLVTKHSSSYEANKILTNEFGTSTSGNQIIIVANNTNIDNKTVNDKLMDFQGSIINYLNSTNIGYKSVTSIYTVENSTLTGFSGNIKGLESGTYGLNKYIVGLYLGSHGKYNASKIEQKIQSNTTLGPLFEKILGTYGISNTSSPVNTTDFIQSAMNIAKSPATLNTHLLGLTVNETYNGSQHMTQGNPYLKINNSTYRSYLYKLNNTTVSSLVPSTIKNNSYNRYPVLPSEYASSSLINTKNDTTILIFKYSGKLTSAEQTHIESIESSYSKKIPNSNYYLAGSTVSSSQLSGEISHGMIMALAIGIIISIAIVGIYFRSPVTAFVPFLMFVFSSVISGGIIGILYKYVLGTKISYITPTLLFILILGIASDYSVYILSRYRTERRNRSKEPVSNAAKWAGHAVFTSGLAVAISYIVLWLSNIPLFSDAGFSNAIAAVITIIIANTLLISLISILNDKIFYPSKIRENQKLPFERSMEKVSKFTLKNRKKIFVIFAVVTVSTMYLYAETPTNMDVFSLLPASSGMQSLTVVNSSFHYDLFDPAYVMVNFTSPLITHSGKNITYNKTEYNHLLAMENRIKNSSYVAQVYGIGYPFGKPVSLNSTGQLNVRSLYMSDYGHKTNSYIGNNSHYAEIVIYLSNIAWSSKSAHYVNNLSSIVSSSGGDYKAYVGGLTSYLNNAYSFTLSSFEKMVPILGFAVFAILLIQLSSAFTPVRLILMVMAAVIMALSLTYIIFYYILHLPLIIFLPLFVFITMLAVGLDYDIFMVSRVKENVMNGQSNDDAIGNAIVENGGVIITLGTLLFATFGALYFSGIPILQEIGVGLALGALIDTFVSWMFFVPIIMLLLDKYNWWPSKIKKTEK